MQVSSYSKEEFGQKIKSVCVILIFLSFTLIDQEPLITSADEFSSKSISRKRFYLFVRIPPYCPNLLVEPVTIITQKKLEHTPIV